MASNYTGLSRGQFYFDNDVFIAKKGLNIVTLTATDPGMRDCFVQGNRFWLSADFQGAVGFDSSDIKKCIDVRPEFGNVTDIKIENNPIDTFDNYAAYAIHVGAFAADTGPANVTIKNNTISNFSTAIVLGQAPGQTANVDCSDNNIVEVKPNTSAPTNTFGIFVQGKHSKLRIRDNSFSGPAAGHPKYGVLFDPGASAVELDADFNYADADSTADAAGAVGMTVASRRKGAQAS